MATTTVRTWTNITLPPAPAVYRIPDDTGTSVPAGKTGFTLNIDQANVPAGQQYEFQIQFQRNAAYTDAAGVQHPAGEWLDTAGGVFNGGPGPKGGTVNHLNIGIPSRLPYPDNVRVEVRQMHVWLFPTITLTAS